MLGLYTMWSRNQRQVAVRLFVKRVSLLALFALFAIAAAGVWGVYQKARESGKLRKEAELEKADLVERQARLQEDISKLNTDRGLEEALRQQFALAEQGERLIVIVDPPSATSVKATTSIGTWFKNTFWWW